MKVEATHALVINAPEFFEDEAFMKWLSNGELKFTWHATGSLAPDDYSDVIVCVDPGLGGEGFDSDMPEHIWNQIVQACRLHLGPRQGCHHYMVRLTNVV